MEDQFVICVKNDDYEVSLERWKVYRTLPDEKATRYHQIRIIDESGEDYLFPKSYFFAIQLPEPVKQAWLLAA